MGMALQLSALNGVPLIRKTMFHDGVGGYMMATDFIRNELAAGNVKHEAAKQWLKGLMSLAE